MSNAVAVGLMANLERVKAQERIHAGNFDPEAYEAVHELYLKAFGNVELAQRAKSRAMERYIDSKVASHGKQHR